MLCKCSGDQDNDDEDGNPLFRARESEDSFHSPPLELWRDKLLHIFDRIFKARFPETFQAQLT